MAAPRPITQQFIQSQTSQLEPTEAQENKKKLSSLLIQIDEESPTDYQQPQCDPDSNMWSTQEFGVRFPNIDVFLNEQKRQEFYSKTVKNSLMDHMTVSILQKNPTNTLIISNSSNSLKKLFKCNSYLKPNLLETLNVITFFIPAKEVIGPLNGEFIDKKMLNLYRFWQLLQQNYETFDAFKDVYKTFGFAIIILDMINIPTKNFHASFLQSTQQIQIFGLLPAKNTERVLNDYFSEQNPNTMPEIIYFDASNVQLKFLTAHTPPPPPAQPEQSIIFKKRKKRVITSPPTPDTPSGSFSEQEEVEWSEEEEEEEKKSKEGPIFDEPPPVKRTPIIPKKLPAKAYKLLGREASIIEEKSQEPAKTWTSTIVSFSRFKDDFLALLLLFLSLMLSLLLILLAKMKVVPTKVILNFFMFWLIFSLILIIIILFIANHYLVQFFAIFYFIVTLMMLLIHLNHFKVRIIKIRYNKWFNGYMFITIILLIFAMMLMIY